MLPTRAGVGHSTVGLPAGSWTTLIEFLVARFPGVKRSEWLARMARGEVVDEAGARVEPEGTYRPHSRLFYYRSLPQEARNPAQETVLFEDEWLVVADKPHFLPVTPSGAYLQETLLVRLRCRLGIDDLAPLHRIDRETAGLVLFVKQAATRARYQALFAQQAIHKTYQAIAPWRTDLHYPLSRTSVLEGADNFMQMREAQGAGTVPASRAARTTIELLETNGPLARFRLHPLTGRRHQLRVHMAAAGMPIVGDLIYPALRPAGSDDPGNPLRLLAEQVAFTDPVTGQARRFTSRGVLRFPDLSTPPATAQPVLD